MERTSNDLRLAVLIDADNIPYRSVKGIMEEVTKYGNPTFKRIYGDWTNPHLIGWKKVLLENAITPFQQYSYTSGKNSTDSAMIIDAMDILYTGRVDGFCLITSDSDFTRLAVRLRESGMKVIVTYLAKSTYDSDWCIYWPMKIILWVILSLCLGKKIKYQENRQ